MKRGPKPKLISQRFWPKVNKNGPISIHASELGRCWIWTGALTDKGYARILETRKRKSILGHRVAYELLIGKIPNGYILDHLCRVRNCVNPNHLEIVTHRINILRGDGLAAKNFLKIQCPRGHAYETGNIYYEPDGRRRCLICKRERARLYWRRKSA